MSAAKPDPVSAANEASATAILFMNISRESRQISIPKPSKKAVAQKAQLTIIGEMGMPVSKEKADLKRLLRDNPEAIARYLTTALATNELGAVLAALNRIVVAQNVSALARETGLRRDNLYGTFGGTVDPTLGRLLAVLGGLNVRLMAVPWISGPPAPRPKLGRARKRKLT